MPSNATYPELPILIIDDELDALDSASLILKSNGIDNTITLQDSRNVLDKFREIDISIVLLDLTMPHISGESILEQIQLEYPHVPTLVLTGAMDIDTAVRCMSKGAFDYMVKPVEESRLISGIRRAIEFRELKRENAVLKNYVLSGDIKKPDAFENIITADLRMINIFKYIEAIANSPLPVLVTGETGVGKELIANSIHSISSDSGKFIPLNVSGIDASTLSDSLFGHIKGAFTGADSERLGAVAQAQNGTLFLDEIGDLDSASQIKLLRLLQENEYTPLGSDIPKRSTARIVAATNINLKDKVEQGTFRKDLYYRLEGHSIYISPLRERRKDIPLLFEYFLKEASRKMKKEIPSIPIDSLQYLINRNYPGNVREIRSMAYDSLSRETTGEVTVSLLKSQLGDVEQIENEENYYEHKATGNIFSECSTLPTLSHAIELLIDEALERTAGAQSDAACQLGITPSALSQRLKRRRELKQES